MGVQNSPNHNCDVLWQEARQGNKTAFEMLYNETIISLSNFALRILKDEHVVKDILQDVFVSVYLRREKIVRNINIVAYLHKAVQYQVAQVRRNRANCKVISLNSEEVIDQSVDVSTEIGQANTQLELLSNIRTLPERCRTAFMMNYRDELPYKEIAARMNISSKTVEKHISRALRILRSSPWSNNI